MRRWRDEARSRAGRHGRSGSGSARQGVTLVLDDRVTYEPPPLHVPTLDELVIDGSPRETRQQRRARERDEHKRARKKGGWPL